MRPKSMISEVPTDQVVSERQVVLINSDEIRIKLPLEGLDLAKPYRPPMFGNQPSIGQFVELGSSPLVSKSTFLKAIISLHRFSTVKVGGKSMPDVRITFDIQDPSTVAAYQDFPMPVCSRQKPSIAEDSKDKKKRRFKLKLK